MAYQVLARKYRPQRFSDVAGQEHVTRTLLNALSQGRIAHGYIFSGHRGIGKTTIARILAMALNCQTMIGTAERPDPEPCGVCVSCQEIRAGNAVDMLEIDAATNRGIDEIRELRDAARYSPSRDRYKVYLLDEAHQITDAAFNALLKTLEEPPDHVIFMMATTQPEDIPQTIRSRCQHFSFHAVKFEDILSQLHQIAELEGILAEDGALALLAEAGDGSMRDALSIMDQATASAPLEDGIPKLQAEQIRELMGNVPNTVFERLLEDIHGNRAAAVMEQANRLLSAGNSPSQIARQMVRYLRNCLMAKLGGETTELLQISADERARAARSSALFSEEDLTRFLQVMLRTFDELNYRQEQRFHLELGLIKLVHLERLIPLEQLLSRTPGSSRPPQSNVTSPASGAASSTGRQNQSPSPLLPPQKPSDPVRPADYPAAKESPGISTTVVSVPSTATVAPSAPMQVVSPFQTAVAPQEIHGASASPPAIRNVEPDPQLEPAREESTPMSLERVRDAIVTALGENGHNTAASLLAAGQWRWDDEGAIRTEVGIKKTMLGLTMNAEAWKIVREALRELGLTQKMTVVPAETSNGVSAFAASLPSGSIQNLALENPLVRQAQELFRAEVRSVLDLREGSRENSRNK